MKSGVANLTIYLDGGFPDKTISCVVPVGSVAGKYLSYGGLEGCRLAHGGGFGGNFCG